jgi:phytoene dehydrogenase-like protein
MTDAVVVGAGPNGLGAAVALAKEGIQVTVLEAEQRIGGGTKTSELTVPGVLHDECSAIHPAGAASPFFSSLGLAEFGLNWRWPDIDCAHPLDDGTAGAQYRSIERTAEALGGRDARVWRALFASTVRGMDKLAPELLAPVLRVPKHPLLLARFGAPGLPPATLTGRLFGTERARGLFAGNVAHAFYPFNQLLTATLGMGIITMGHRYGWPVAEGGSRAITDALAGLLTSLGGKIETGVRVRSLAELPAAEITMLDLAPRAVAELAGDRLPAKVRRAYLRYRHGPAAFKVDYAVADGVPWTAEEPRSAGTVHVGGTMAEIAAAEADCARGIMPERPFVLVGQQYLADPGRSGRVDGQDVHPVYAYAHVPHGYSGDATAAITAQIERFAPGFAERIVASVSRSPAQLQQHNTNYLGGDIIGGLNNQLQLLARPRLTLDPYRTGIPGVYICSQSTPPGAAVHGMCGYHAAQSALRSRR